VLSRSGNCKCRHGNRLYNEGTFRYHRRMKFYCRWGIWHRK
jgi:hypothetical protein